MTEPETIAIDDLDQFVKILVHWHQGKVGTLQHMLEIPDGTVMELSADSTTSVTLTGDMLDGFKAGLGLALMELGELPFLYEQEPEQDTVTVGAA